MSLEPIAVQTDSTAGGGPILAPVQGYVRVNGLLVVVEGTDITGHGDDEHSSAKTGDGIPYFRIDGIPINVQSDVATCGHVIENGVSWLRVSK